MRNVTRPGVELAAGLLDPQLWAGDPYPLLGRLRREAPVAWNDEHGFWALSRHHDVVAVESDPDTFCAGRGILVEEIGVTYDSPPTMMHSDPPVHTRYRRLVQPGFKPSVVRALEPVVQARAAVLVDALAADRPVDVVGALAVPLPIQIIGEVLGVDETEWERVHEWSEAVIPGATDWPEERRRQLMGDMVSTLLAATEARRRSPRHDVLSALAQASLDGDRLSDAELSMFLVQLLVAGNETTRNLLSGGLVAFSTHPGQWRRLRADASSVPGAVEEMLRWTTPVTSFMRTATRDADVGGQHIAAGEPVLMLYASANRDESVFGDGAATFDIGRDPNPHLSFGFGNHFCLGAALARLEARVVLEQLAERFTSVTPAGHVERTGSSVIAGIRHADLCFTS